MLALGLGLGVPTRRGGTPPAPVSATILADGVTLRLVFDKQIIRGSATDGLSRSVGSITSGTISGVNLDLTIPQVYSGESVGTISYDDNTGTLAGTGGPVQSFSIPVVNSSWSGGALWTPASLPSIVDYGVHTDWTRLKQDSAGTVAVTAADDPIGFWRGQLDVLTFTQATAGTKPKAAADGVHFLAAGAQKRLDAAFAAPYSEPITLAQRIATQESEVLMVAHAGVVSAPTSRVRMPSVTVRGTTTTIGAGWAAGDDIASLLTTDNAIVADAYRGEANFVATVGAGTTDATAITLVVSSSAAADVKHKGWVVTRSHLTQEQARNLQWWLWSIP